MAQLTQAYQSVLNQGQDWASFLGRYPKVYDPELKVEEAEIMFKACNSAYKANKCFRTKGGKPKRSNNQNSDGELLPS